MIHILDWIVYFISVWIIGKMMPKDFKEEVGGATIGCGLFVIYTIIYCIIFWYFDWVTIVQELPKHFTL